MLKLTVAISFFLLLIGLRIEAQNIVKAEYFLDADPGFGKGIDVPVTPGTDITVSFQVPVNAIPLGFHNLYFRTYANPYQVTENKIIITKGGWSLTKQQSFYKQDLIAGSLPNITRGEYYVDTDPGFGKGNDIPVTPGTDLSGITFPLNITSYAVGFHSLHIRFANANGAWSLTSVNNFYKQDLTVASSSLPNITRGEYFVDADPGFGKGINIPLTPGIDLSNLVFPIEMTAISPGFHNLSIRFANADGAWSLTSVRNFYKQDITTTGNALPNITKGEYFFDTDPGFGKGKDIPVTAGTDLSFSFTTDLQSIPAGFHQLHIRFANAGGNWGQTNVHPFYKQVSVASDTLSSVVKAEYFIDADPGFGKAKQVAITPATDINNLVFPIDMSDVLPGNHKIYVRAQSANGAWSLTNTGSFKADSSSALFIKIGNLPGTVCSGSLLPVPFTLSAPFGIGNTFTAQLSDSSGSFRNPVNIGTLTGRTSDTIRATIPANTLSGNNYKIRIISILPIDTSAESITPLIIKGKPAQAFTISGKTNSCIGKQTYTATPSITDIKYLWEIDNGGTIDTSGATVTVTWNVAGMHLLKLTPSNACGSGQQVTLSINVFNAPPTLTPVIFESGGRLHASISGINDGVTGYQWFRDGSVIEGAVDSIYAAVDKGSYTASFTNPCGAGPQSNSIVVSGRQSQTIVFPVIPSKTYGTDTAFSITATASSGLPVTFRIVSGPAAITGNIVSIQGAGAIIIEASQSGNTTYGAATPVLQTLVVNQALQTITFDAVIDTTKPGTQYRLTARSSAGLPITFNVLGQATIAGVYLIIKGSGLVTVRAVQLGNQNYVAAFAEKQFCISPTKPGIINGFKQVCKGTQNYSVESLPGVRLTWTVTGGTLLSATGNAVTVNWTQLGTQTLTVASSVDCDTINKPSTALTVQVIDNLIPGAVGNLYPAEGTVIGSFPVLFSWKPAVNADMYDIYIWLDGTTVPATPVITNTNQIAVLLHQSDIPDFTDGKKYNWKVVAKNGCAQTASAIQSFRLNDLPNLVVRNVQVPDTIFSGRTIDITAEIFNTGKAGTGSAQWYDVAYLSADSVLDADVRINSEIYLTAKSSVSSLAPGKSYTTTFSGVLPFDAVGKYYLIVAANKYKSLTEVNLQDNTGYKQFQINLTPTPDLKPVSVITRGDIFSGQDLNIEAIIKNIGPGNTTINAWRDGIYLSPDSVFNAGNAIKLSEISKKRFVVKPDSSYTINTSVTLPVRLFGRNYIYVVADLYNEVYEYSAENNNTGRSDAVNILLTPPPDFVIADITAPATAASGETITVDVSVLNQGASTPAKNEPYWQDGLYISKDSIFNINTAVPLNTSSPHPFPLMYPGEKYHSVFRASIPTSFSGIAYIYAVTDINDDVFEFNKENNNTAGTQIEIINPDLTITKLNAPDSANAGSSIEVSWVVSNQGRGKVVQKDRRDIIVLSSSTEYHASTAMVLGEVDYNTTLDPAASTLKQASIRIPDSVSGKRYILVQTDNSNQVVETNENNNWAMAYPILIITPPRPDLSILQISVSADTMTAEKYYAFHYTGVNQGAGELTGKSWMDGVYKSMSPVLDSRAIKIRDIPRNDALQPNASYEVTDSLSFGLEDLRDADTATWYIHIRAEKGNDIYESDEQNNSKVSKPITVRHDPYPDLVVTSVSGWDSAYSGKTTTVGWSVKNAGGQTGFSSYWYDAVVFSKDTVFDSRDNVVATKVINGPVASGESYNSYLSFSVPNGISGDYYMLLVSDYYKNNKDKNRANNAKLINIKIGNSSDPVPVITPIPIHIVLSPSADLAINSFIAPSTAYAGQPITVKWEVINKGVAATSKGNWLERICLSTDDKLDFLDRSLQTYTRIGNLNPNASYMDSAQVFLPVNSTGNFYLIFSTDDNNSIYEFNGESDNTASSILFVMQPALSDLVVSGVSMPVQASIGGNIKVVLKTKNIGTNPANGYVSQGIYLSQDSVWDKDDVLLSVLSQSINLPPLAEATDSAIVKLQGVMAGTNYAIVHTDLLNNIPEEDEENNYGSSENTINIAVPELPINVLTPVVLQNNNELYYRIEVPDSLQGKTLLVSLKGDSLNSANEMYIRYASVPSRIKFDIAYSKALSGSQDIIIPSLQKGTYYLLAYGASSRLRQQNITLLAKEIKFSILDVIAKEGGNTGTVTIKITGARFEDGMRAKLINNGPGIIAAQKVRFINSTSIFVTFNLQNASTGMYDLSLVRTDGDSTSLKNGFTVVTGSAGGVVIGGDNSNGFYCYIKNEGTNESLGADVQFPEKAGVGHIFPMTIIFGNSGNVDIPIPKIMMSSMSGAPITLAEDLSQVLTDLLLEFKEAGGPDDVLRPGATGSIRVFSQLNERTSYKFTLLQTIQK